MVSFFQRHRQPLISLFVMLLFTVGFVTMEGLEKQTFHTTFFVAMLLTILHYLLTWSRNRRKIRLNESWKKIEFVVLSILVFIQFLAGAIESYHLRPLVWGSFILGLFLVIVNAVFFLKRTGVSVESLLLEGRARMKFLLSSTIGLALIILMFAHKEHLKYEYLFDLWSSLFILLLAFLFVPWLFRQIRLITSLKSEQTKTELQHLQSQVNPHFFFNTLNNLYGLIEKDSKKAQELVLKLSDMMRYSIYEGQKDVVNLEEEVSYIQNYIELHKSRYHKKTDVQFNTHLQAEGVTIMPLLFIILLENAFKHGVENLSEKAYVHINLVAGESELTFGIENNFDEDQEVTASGIGLANLKRRLELVYPRKHTLSFSGSNGVYKAQLSLTLK